MNVNFSPNDQLEHLTTGAATAGIDVDRVHLPESRTVIANAIRIHFLEWGDPDAPPALFLHGGSLTAHTWDLICLALSDRYRCIAMDLRGHGDSEWPSDADYRFEAFAADAAALIEILDLHRPVVVGMSLGGLTSLELAGQRSDELSGLVVIDVGPDLRVDGAREIVAFTQHDQEMNGVEDFVQRAMSFNPARRPELLRRSLLHNLRQLPTGRWTWKWDKRRMADADFDQMAVVNARLWDRVAKISCPALIVRGDRSRVFLDDDAAKLAGAMAGEATWTVVANAGHTVQGDNPRGLLDVLEPFLGDVLTRG
jgi:esterase